VKIKVLIADDSPIMRKAVRELLETEADIEIVGEAVNFEQMLAMKEKYQPEIVIMDLHMIEDSGALPEELKLEGSRLLAISARSKEDGEPKAKEIGASAFLDKNGLYGTLIPKIYELRDGM
jgi:DNA-binding NarL/FixJ family response regulator